MNKTVELALGAYEIDAQFVIARRNDEAISTSEASLRGGTTKQSPSTTKLLIGANQGIASSRH